MKSIVIITLAGASAALAQTDTKPPIPPMPIQIADMVASKNLVQGAPYSATMVNESIQTLADGNRIVKALPEAPRGIPRAVPARTCRCRPSAISRLRMRRTWC